MKKTIAIVFGLLLFGMISFAALTNVIAEQGGLSPESGANSRLKTLSDSLTSSGYGFTSSGSWGDWGSMWNRIYSSATWTPNTSNNAVAGDVAAGKKFYSGNNRTEYTGTAVSSEDFTYQAFCVFDTYYLDVCPKAKPAAGATWTNTASNVWKDNRTGLYWTEEKTTATNSHNAATGNLCDLLVTNPRGNYAGGDADCGNAMNYCATLSQVATTGQAARTTWYLPSITELKQALNDDMYNQAGSAFTTSNYFHSTSMMYGNYGWNYVWTFNLSSGQIDNSSTVAVKSVRCVSRD